MRGLFHAVLDEPRTDMPGALRAKLVAAPTEDALRRTLITLHEFADASCDPELQFRILSVLRDAAWARRIDLPGQEASASFRKTNQKPFPVAKGPWFLCSKTTYYFLPSRCSEYNSQKPSAITINSIDSQCHFTD